MFPRYGSYPGFNPIVELSMTFHTQVVGANGQRQAMFIERTPGLAEVILSNFTFGPNDLLMIFSASGLSAVPVEMARGARRRGLRVIAVTSVEQSMSGEPDPIVGGRLLDEADLVIDLCSPAADALCTIDGLDTPVGPGSTITAVAIVNCIKVRTARLLAERGSAATGPDPSVGRRRRALAGFDSRTPIESMRGGSLVPSPGRGDGHRHHAQEVRRIDRIDRLPGRGPCWIVDATRSARRPERGGERMIKASTRARLLVGMAVIAVVAAACTTGGGASTAPSAAPPASVAPASAAPASVEPASAAPASAAAKTYTIGYSNAGGVGNGFREEQVCTAKAEAAASGQVSTLTTIHRNTDAAGQLSDIRDLIAKGVNAIVFNPNDPAALNPALAEAKAAGIVTVSVDAYVTDTTAYNLYNNQVKYAELGAKWLFDQMGGTGTVCYMRGLAGHPADSDRDIGFKNVLKDYPNIKIVPNADGVATGWDPATATKLINDFIASGQYDSIQGIWTSGMDSMVVDAIKAANKKFVPIVGADLGGFVTQLLDPTGFPA